ncbi:MAG: ribosome maturation factor RimM [Bacteroidetes bacterium]|nr:ribosome maturation factor RimM [Bacteroidota bacterium]MCL5025559.1 ribosome maturation factor RimM [Chloroflexota bacterium]
MDEDRPPPPSHLVVAQVVAPWGLKGDVKARVLTDFPQRFRRGLQVFLGEAKTPYVVDRARLQRGWLILKLRGCDTQEQAGKLRDALVYVAAADAVTLPEGQYYWHQIIGLRVKTANGEDLGVVGDILTTGSNDVYVVQGPRGEILVPALDDVIQRVDLEAGQLVVDLPEGLL